MRVTLESLSAKISALHEAIKELKELVLTQNGRVRKLEQFRSWMLGGMGVILFLLTIGAIKLFV